MQYRKLLQRPNVFGIGLSNTRTEILGDALDILGFRTCACETMEESSPIAWQNGDFCSDHMKRCDAMTGLPVAIFFEHLDKHYPKAKFVLTTRDKNDWLASCEESYPRTTSSSVTNLTTMGLAYGSSWYRHSFFSSAYDTHMESVYRYFRDRPNDILIINLFKEESWDRLCRFLNCGIPGKPFPATNIRNRLPTQKNLVNQFTQLWRYTINHWRGLRNNQTWEEAPVFKPQFDDFSPKLTMWYRESYQEINRWNEDDPICVDYAIYPRRFYSKVAELSVQKKFDYCFIGGLETDIYTMKNRAWILDFIDDNFTEQSFLQFTDSNTKNNYSPKGSFDFTLLKEGFVPKENKVEVRNWFDENYFRTMLASKFTLCPAGDAIYSMRFYEALMCKSIPIVRSVHETFRSEAESKLDYRYYLSTDDITYREDWIEHNYKLFLKYHTLEYASYEPKY